MMMIMGTICCYMSLLTLFNPSYAEHDMPCLSNAGPDQLASAESN